MEKACNHPHHIVPDTSEHQGLTTPDNLQTLCASCNSAKGSKVIDYRRASGRFDVILEDAGASKIRVIKVVKPLSGLGLKQAKQLVESAPALVLRNVDAATAEAARSRMTSAGARVSIARSGATA